MDARRNLLTSVSNRVPLRDMLAARELRQAVLAADEKFLVTARAGLQPIEARLRRKPELREDLILDFVRYWRERVESDPFHVMWSAKPDRRFRALELTECRLSASVWRDDSWAEPAFENGVSLTKTVLTMGHGTMSSACTPLVVVSMHALARRYERATDPRQHAVLADLGDCVRSANWYPNSGDYVIDVAGGRWLGSSTTARSDHGGTVELYAVRTFIGPKELALT
jgi:hypothetical protein